MNSNQDVIHSDVQAERTGQDLLPALESVGMSNVQVSLKHSSGHLIPAHADLMVNLKSGRRGIHMSRIYELMLSEIEQKTISEISFKDILQKMLSSQDGDSSEALIHLKWDEICFPTSLKSNRKGTRVYPVQLQIKRTKDLRNFLNLQIEVLYSSTCPQSLALSKELSRSSNATYADFVATPHAQRSRMNLILQYELDKTALPFAQNSVAQLIEICEKALKTPVQTVVKKADEMEFARLNAENPMFCEDAVRVVAREFQRQQTLLHFAELKITARHEESLHAHDAVASLRTPGFLQF